jgi:hypothetical protein
MLLHIDYICQTNNISLHSDLEIKNSCEGSQLLILQ